jgi:two-component system response regulator PilR (NtrC family)
VRKVGSTTEENVDVRIISATHRNLGDEVKRGEFRQDLYYRLNVIELRMPSLREMREDIPMLAALLLSRQVGNANDTGGGAPRLSAGAVAALRQYDFPGNVRELENILERALALASGDEIAEDDLRLANGAVDDAHDGDADLSRLSLPEKLESIERQAILAALEKTRYNRTAAAKLLGVSFRALRYRMERLGIKDELDARS